MEGETRPQAAAQASADAGWVLDLESAPENEAADESLFALADGWLGVRAGLEERPSASDGAFLSDVFERLPIDYHERFPGLARATDTRVPVADGKRVRILVGADGEDLAQTGELLRCRRALDLRTGRLTRTALWRTAGGGLLRVTAERTASLRRPGLWALRMSVASETYAGPIALESRLEPARGGAAKSDDPRMGVGAGGLIFVSAETRGGAGVLAERTHHSGIVVLAAQVHLGDGEDVGPLTRRLCGELRPGGRLILEKVIGYETCREAGEIEPATAGLAARLTAAASLGFEGLSAEQARELSRFWNRAAVAIEGEPELELAVRLNLFHLRQSADGRGRSGLAAKGLTGEGYEGHVFWDAEVFMLPVLAHADPSLVRAHLAWRHSRLDAARAHAREMNFATGALFPWRTIEGGECSAYFPAGSAQLHINAAVAWAIGRYVEASGDREFLAQMGAEVLFDTARIWLQAGRFSERRGGDFCIYEVTGPDEYSALVDNNYYTNLMAQAHLRQAAEVAAWLQAERPEIFAALADRLGLSAEEPAAWRAAAEAMHLPVDPALGVHPQDDGFLDKPRLDFSGVEGGPLLLSRHPLTLYRHQVCKQGDVALGLVLQGREVPLQQKRRDYDYYQAITTHDSTLSPSTFAVLGAEVGAGPSALRHLASTALVDLKDLHGNTSHGVHLAAMAGSWLGLVWGFAGLRMRDGAAAFRPALPPHWTGLEFRLGLAEALIAVRFGPQHAEYRLLEGEAVEIEHEGEPLLLTANAPVVRPWGKAAPLEAVIFDLDGVITDTARAHYRAWKGLADRLGIAFDEAANEALKGLDRMASLRRLLGPMAGQFAREELEALAAQKNAAYLQEIATLTPKALLPGALAAVEGARAAGLKTALASASRNAPAILEHLGVAHLFDVVADPAAVPRGKPAPDLFLAAAELLGVSPARCLAVEDSAAGVAAIKAAGMTAIGVGDPAALAEADLVIGDLTAFKPRRPTADPAPLGSEGARRRDASDAQFTIARGMI